VHKNSVKVIHPVSRQCNARASQLRARHRQRLQRRQITDYGALLGPVQQRSANQVKVAKIS